ncbi:hypothetical protein [Labedaea rhizosphaerae]|uniref:Uncharacterized protein n=1 Tax=Labedaea rhizosphaerae TaxID=598644 RepID=A0A4R6SLQ3_LABRH|nr:hypothetical protein [Labedaea rhizosphaerae]TDQ04242.1 hypothetical protein EV186_101185 [Labedaea rhizosphaerae]
MSGDRLDQLGLDETGELGRGLPAILLRVLIALTCLGIVGVLALDHTEPAGVLVVAVVAVLSIGLPASPSPALLIVLAAGLIVVGHKEPLSLAALAMIPLVHLLHVSCGIAGMLPLRARVHLAALRRPAVRYLMVQTGVFLVAGIAALLPEGATPAVLEVLALLSVAALGLVIARMAHRPQ